MPGETTWNEAVMAADPAAPDCVRVTGTAYTGGAVRQWWGDTVIDVEGMEVSAQVPLLDSHSNTIRDKVGEARVTKSGSDVLIEGRLLAGSDKARYIAESGRQSRWQLSIGADVVECRRVRERESVRCNGRDFAGPLLLVTRSRLREVSVVAVGADSGTAMVVEAAFDLRADESTRARIMSCVMEREEREMPKNEANEVKEAAAVRPGGDGDAALEAARSAARDAVQAERARVAAVTAVCAGECPDVLARAVAEGWTEAETTAKVLEAVRAARPAKTRDAVPAPAGAGVLECALGFRAGLTAEDLAADHDERTVKAAERMDITLRDFCRECVRLEGGSAPSSGFGASDIRAAFSTVALPGVLSNVANKRLLKGFQAAEVTAPTLCGSGSIADFKVSNRVRVDVYGDLQEVPPGGEFQDGSVGEATATNQLRTYGQKFCLTRQMIINDDMDEFLKIPRAYGGMAARLQDRLFYTLLNANGNWADGKTFFHADHNNDLEADDLSVATLGQAVAMFGRMTDEAGHPVAIRPRYLVVAPEQEIAANELVTGGILIAGSGSVLRPASNGIVSKGLQVVSTPWLTSGTWYLFADPSEVECFELAYLNGRRAPVVERGDTDFTTLGMWFRVYFDIGCAPQEYRGVVRAHTNSD